MIIFLLFFPTCCNSAKTGVKENHAKLINENKEDPKPPLVFN